MSTPATYSTEPVLYTSRQGSLYMKERQSLRFETMEELCAYVRERRPPSGKVWNLEGMDLSGQDFSGAGLDGVSLAGAKLHKTNFSGAQFKYTQVKGADFSGADFTGAQIAKTEFRKTNVKDARFGNAGLRGVLFMDADLTCADFTGATMDGVSSADCDFTDAVFAGAHLRDAALNQSDFTRASFAGARIGGHFSFNLNTAAGTDFTGVNSAGCKGVLAHGTDLSRAIMSHDMQRQITLPALALPGRNADTLAHMGQGRRKRMSHAPK